MANVEYHTGVRGYPGFTISTVGTDGKTYRQVLPAYVPIDSTGAPIGGGSASAPSFSQIVNAKGQAAGLPTYVSRFTAYAGYATPTDLFTLTGSASKTIIVTGAVMNIQSTASTPSVLSLVKRSTANTGGTSTNPGSVTYDSQAAAASATTNLYTVAPTPGVSVGILLDIFSTTGTLTASPGTFSFMTAGRLPIMSVTDMRQPVTLRGAGEVLAMNWGGAALPGGFIASGYFEWIEF